MILMLEIGFLQVRAVKLKAGKSYIKPVAQHLYSLELFCHITPSITPSTPSNEGGG